MTATTAMGSFVIFLLSPHPTPFGELGIWGLPLCCIPALFILAVRRYIGRAYMTLKEKRGKELKSEQLSQLVLHSHLLSDNIYLKEQKTKNS